MSMMSPLSSQGPWSFYTSMGPTSNPGGFSDQSFGAPGLLNFGFPSYGDPLFYRIPAASSFFINKLLAAANGSAVNINIGPAPSTLGLSNFLLGAPFFGGGASSPGNGPWGPGGPSGGSTGTAGGMGGPYGGYYQGGGNPFGGFNGLF